MIRKVFRQHPIRDNNHVELLQSGAEFFNRAVEIIRKAKNHIHLQTYIFDEDKTGKLIAEELIQAAERGVKVFLVVDAYASQQLSTDILFRFERAGIRYKSFSPLVYSKFKIGRRLHHKIILVDTDYALIGGINIADKYSGFSGHTPWLDFAIEISGYAVADIEKICESIWKRRIFKSTGLRFKIKDYKKPASMQVRVLQNDWLRRRIEISRMYKDEIRHAKDEIFIVASYFLPGSSLRRLIRKASERGVKITLVTGEFSDVSLFKPATMYLYNWLFRNKVEIYEWKPSVLHGKMAIFDQKHATVGSYNINALSDYGSIELNALVLDDAFAAKIQALVKKLVIENGKQLAYEDFIRDDNRFLRFYRWICFLIIRFSLALLFMLMQGRSKRY